MNNITKYTSALLLTCLFFLVSLPQASAQIEQVTVSGVVKDETGKPLPVVSVVVKNQPGLGTTAQLDGKYTIKAGENDVLVFSFMGYEIQEIAINGRTTIDVNMVVDNKAMEEVTIVAAGVQRKVSVVGAITTVKMADLSVSTNSLSNALAGNVAGVIAVQRSGEPGENGSEFWIRGISTFGANASALVLVDGIERKFDELNIEDIESFTVLKDASATAIYGQRGANGVVLITTKRGKEGKVQINFKSEYTVGKPIRMPEYVNGMTYASMANEARQTRYQDAIYDPSDMEIIGYNLDPDLYPNIDWHKTMLKERTNNYKANISVGGGGPSVRYFISGSYVKEEGLYKESNLNDYNTNASYKRYNLRINTDVNITKTTVLEAGIAGWVIDQNKPGTVSEQIWGSLHLMTPISVPIRYSNGMLPAYGINNDQISPYVLINETGYQSDWQFKQENNLGLRQDLSFITKGLNFTTRFSYDAYSWHKVYRNKLPALYKAERVRDGMGNLITSRILDERPLQQSSQRYGDRKTYFDANLSYARAFGTMSQHRVGALLYYYQQSFAANDTDDNIFKSVPWRNLALSGRVTYAYDDRYLFEFNFGYTGSENFEKGERFGFFPALALGWIVSNEKFVKDNLPWLRTLKLRFSYGEVGNDRLSTRQDRDPAHQAVRFPYVTTVNSNAPGYNFGNQGANHINGIMINTLGASNLTWEVAKKYNYGIDINIAGAFEASVDIFQDHRDNIFMRRSYMPGTVGLTGDGQRPWGNVGKMKSEGLDGHLSYTHKFGDLTLALRGNFTYAYTKVLDYDEASEELYYKMTKGYKFEQNRGLIAIGYFKDNNDIANSPAQFGEVLPGDIKYKDVTGDGIITDDDIVPIGNTINPEIIYGVGLSVQWKGVDFNILFQGAGKTDFMVHGPGVWPFQHGDMGNVLLVASHNNDRWISREISGTADTERANATFPRLIYGNNINNNRNSTHWLRSGDYLRLKTLEMGYTLPRKITQRWKIERLRVYFLGYNLAIWDSFKWWDPELGNKDGTSYPLTKQFTIGINLTF